LERILHKESNEWGEQTMDDGQQAGAILATMDTTPITGGRRFTKEKCVAEQPTGERGTGGNPVEERGTDRPWSMVSNTWHVTREHVIHDTVPLVMSSGSSRGWGSSCGKRGQSS
jgi:hypothetical protein